MGLYRAKDLRAGLLLQIAFLVFPLALCRAQDSIIQEVYNNIGTQSPQEASEQLLAALSSGELKADHELFPELLNSSALRDSLGVQAINHIKRNLIGYAPDELGEVARFIELYYPAGTIPGDTAATYYELTSQAEAAMGSAEMDSLLEMQSQSTGIAEMRIVEARIIRLGKKISREAMDTDPARALRALSLIPSGLRGKEVHQLASAAIAKFSMLPAQKKDADWALESEKVFALILEISASKAQISELVAKMLDARIIRMLEANRVGDAESAYILVLKVRPSPHDANDKLRVSMLSHADTKEARDFALGRLAELHSQNGKLDFRSRAVLFWEGYYQPNLPKRFLATVIIACTGVILVFFWSRFGKIKKKKKKARKKFELGDASDEYSELLSVFDLDDTATEDQIKKAYRKRIKTLHPDSAKEVDPAKVREFVELQKVHNRIFEIRKGRFGA